jgi:predicted transcriptional regulator
MNTLWPMGEGTVREIRDRLAERRPRAYTTIMTIMDRLARKGVVGRRRVGRAYVYRANLSMEEARAQALRQIVENFFGGSREALLEELGANEAAPRARAAAAGVSAGSAGPGTRGGLEVVPPRTAAAAQMLSLADLAAPDAQPEAAERIDDTLL